MAPKKKSSMSQKGLTGAGFWPMLSKTAVAVGKYCSVPGKFWDGCPSADKETRYKCIVIEFLRPCMMTPGAGSSSLVRNLSDDDDDEPATTAGDYDTVTEEATRWVALDAMTIREFRDDEGIVNEFALVYHLRQSFPLHFIVFKQTASHLPHEANSPNTEQLFSRSGALSDDNGKMDPARLAVWTSIGVNYSTFKPTNEQILERYMLKFSKGGKATAAEMHQDDKGLLDPDGGDGEDCLVQAGSS